jgi:hypothetical protein
VLGHGRPQLIGLPARARPLGEVLVAELASHLRDRAPKLLVLERL